MAGLARVDKTFVLCAKAVLNALAGRRELICSFSYPMLRDVITVTMKEVLNRIGLKEADDWTHNKTEAIFNVRGTEILLRSGDAPDSLRGLNIHDFLIDESRQLRDKTIFDILIGRIRNDENARWYMCTTPNGRDWCYEVSLLNNVTVVTQRTIDNPFLPKSYIKHLQETYTGIFAQQELDGEVVEMVGEIIDTSFFKMIPPLPVSEGVRFYDLAFADKKVSDWTAGALCLMSGSQFCIADMLHVRAKYPDLRRLIIEQALADGPGVKIGLEDVAAQRAVIDDLAREPRLRRFTIIAQRPTGTKLARAMPWVSRARLGDVKVVNAHWTPDFLAECASFRADGTQPHDDQVDAISGAYSCMANVKISSSMRLHL